MNMKVYAAGLCIAAIAATAFAVPAAEAQTTQRGYTTTRVAKAQRPRARVTVAPRSFLDAGTEVLPGERKFNDYAFPPGHTPYSALGPFKDFRRQPLLDPWDFPGTNKYGWW